MEYLFFCYVWLLFFGLIGCIVFGFFICILVNKKDKGIKNSLFKLKVCGENEIERNCEEFIWDMFVCIFLI